MINDKMDIEEIILNLSTRATKLFATGYDIVSVGICPQRSVKNSWQVWFEYWMGGLFCNIPKFLESTKNETTLREALFELNDWLLWKECQALFVRGESIGFGD